MSVILILMAVAIPNYMNMRSQANETAAMEELRTLNSAEIQYQTDYPANGFSCSLVAIGLAIPSRERQVPRQPS